MRCRSIQNVEKLFEFAVELEVGSEDLGLGEQQQLELHVRVSSHD